jgi:hypothetical protein
VSLNPYFYQAEGGDEGLNMDEEWDGVPVGWCVFFTIVYKKKYRERFTVTTGITETDRQKLAQSRRKNHFFVSLS